MRREKGTGSIVQRKDGLWMGSYSAKGEGRKTIYDNTRDAVEVRLSVLIDRQKNKKDETPRMRDNRQRQLFKSEAKAKGRLVCEVCGWDGGGFPEMVEAHHIIPFKCGGQVTDENIILLCPNHHALIHKLIKFKDIGTCKGSIVITLREYRKSGKDACDVITGILSR